MIRKAQVDDAEILSVLATEVWLDTYAQEGISRAFAKHLLAEYSPAAFRNALISKEVSILLCYNGDFVTGYIKLTTERATLDAKYGTAEVATLYVRRHHKRQGIGAMLLREALKLASQAGHKAIYLTVHHANHSAIAFYEARQFRKVGDWLFQFEKIEVLNFIMAINVT